ncbi:MAG TPA: hypothetical protein VL652_17255 [Kutzneria sp.]|jgi:hypothetical protein|nr:hypothetical protein [Kutzneria sp.]
MTTTEDLGPVRAALLRRAQADADQILAAARACARDRVDEARRTAADILDRARQAGAMDAAADAAERHGQVRDRARDAVLAAQREVYDELVTRVTAAISARLTTDVARAALRRVIEDRLGGDAVLADLPDGGVSGSVPGRRLVITAGQLADSGLSQCAARIRQLWVS